MGGITITDTHMSSPDTPHIATATGGGWQVSWLPGRTLDRNQAITAMTIASTIGSNGVPRADDPFGRGTHAQAGRRCSHAEQGGYLRAEQPRRCRRT